MFDDYDDERYADELCEICGQPYQCDEFIHDRADERYAYEPIYDPWVDERYRFMTSEAPF